MTDQVLNECNAIRASVLGLGPLSKMQRGTPKSPLYCPVSQTIKHGSDAYVSVSAISVFVGSHKIKPVPKPIVDFLLAFDRGEIPDMET